MKSSIYNIPEGRVWLDVSRQGFRRKADVLLATPDGVRVYLAVTKTPLSGPVATKAGVKLIGARLDRPIWTPCLDDPVETGKVMRFEGIPIGSTMDVYTISSDTGLTVASVQSLIKAAVKELKFALGL